MTSNKTRVIISTDIGGYDPDDFQSLVHYLVYADLVETEGLISSPPGDGRKEHIIEALEAYKKDYKYLKTWGEYPEFEKLLSVVKQGTIDVQCGEEPSENISEGAQHIIDRAKADDPRPLYILAWGSITDIAQALHKVPEIKNKIRVYYIGSWNTQMDPKARDYIYENHPDLWLIENNYTFRGMYLDGNQKEDLSNTESVDHFLEMFKKVLENSKKLLKK